MNKLRLANITERIRIWRNIIFYKWWKIVWVIYLVLGVFSIIRVEFLPQSNIPPFIEILPEWPWWIWALIGAGILCAATLEGAYHLIHQVSSKDNWIDEYENRYGKLPAVPNYLFEVVANYTEGEPISKDIQLITPSAQFWNNLLPSQQDRLLQLVEWLGQDSRDYVAQMERMLPKSPRVRFL